MLAWPQTYMNRSGFSVRCLCERHGFEPRDLLVVFDDTALSLGTLRLRVRGGPGGHRGMESVIQNLRTDEISRLRLGIAPEQELPAGEDLSDFVLSGFDEDELEVVDKMIERAVAACQCWLDEGTESAMNRFNG
jgi:PTH1 family peptidyl-tRNA hydrolase